MGYVVSVLKGHLSNNCNMNYSCSKCRGKHSISFCVQKDENSDEKNNVSVTGLTTENSNTIVPTTTVNFSIESNNVLLQTACAKITNEREYHLSWNFV